MSSRMWTGRLATAIGAIVLGAASLASAQQALPRMSLEEFVKDPSRLDSLKRGVRVMKERRPSDPRSWFFQAAMHGVPPAWTQAAQAADPGVAGVNQARYWRQCPHYGQSAADFLIWHRAYLHYFERILREAAADPTLSLPYWDYGAGASGRQFPAEFADPDPAPGPNGAPRNPLYEIRREQAFVLGVLDLSDAAVDVTAAMTETRFFGPTESEGLAGGVGDTDPASQGLLESQPHNLLHFAIGGAIGGGGSGVMASVQTAAFDPIFWVHHANIDRLWSTWECLPGRTWGAVPAKQWLEQKPWWFVDADGSEKNVSRLDFLRYDALGVRYSSDDPQCQRLSAHDPSVAVPVAETHRRFVLARSADAGTNQEDLVAAAAEPVSVTVPLNNRVLGAATVSAALNAAPANRSRRVFLELRGITRRSVPSVGYQVYIELPRDAGAAPPRHLAGTLALFGLETSDGRRSATQRFDVTAPVRSAGGAVTAIRVVLVPFDLYTGRYGQRPIHNSGDVRIDTVAVTLAESE